MNLLELFAPIRTFVFDVDGVLTDGSIMLSEDGRALRRINIKDIYAIQFALKKGYKVWILSDSTWDGLQQSLNSMGIPDVLINIGNKKEFIIETATTSNTSYESILYMGDDLPDHHAMQLCGLPCCPNDAVKEIKHAARYISPFSGGKGCVRDVIEKTLKLNGDWEIPG